MAFDVKGWRRGPEMGSIGSGVGSVKYKHFYVTNDDGPAVIAANYFNPLSAQLNKGDVIECSLDVDGTSQTKTYVVTSANGAATVVIALQTTT